MSDKLPCPPCYGRGWNLTPSGKQNCNECGGTGRLEPMLSAWNEATGLRSSEVEGEPT